ncbi:MAG: thioredoxin family protein [Candidatus Firestonebacteria bacterium]
MKKFVVFLFVAVFLFTGCSGEKKQVEQKGNTRVVLVKEKMPGTPEIVVVKAIKKIKKQVEPLVTFVELGSVNCIPCKMMQKVLREVDAEYKDKVKIIFYDVWTPEGKPFGQKYFINVIPTQIFLDKTGKEFFRHEGYFPKEDIEALFAKQGISKIKH